MSASGGAFFPGIEVGWQIREPGLFRRAVPDQARCRVAATSATGPAPSVGAGYFSRQMALPWLADFLQCEREEQGLATPKTTWGWWPSQRPDAVYPTADAAAKQGAMLPWHRATVGPSSAWPSDPGEPSPRPADMPSFEQMIANWWKFGVVSYAPGQGYAESDRAGAVP